MQMSRDPRCSKPRLQPYNCIRRILDRLLHAVQLLYCWCPTEAVLAHEYRLEASSHMQSKASDIAQANTLHNCSGAILYSPQSASTLS